MSEKALTNATLPMPDENLILTMSKLPPRDMEATRRELRDLVIGDRGMLKKSVYCKPVGSKKGGAMEFALGPGIRFAECAFQAFGYLWIRVRTVSETNPSYDSGRKKPGSVTTEAVCIDLRKWSITHAEDTSPVWSENTKETARDRSYSLARRDAIMQQVRPQVEALVEDVYTAISRDITNDDLKEAFKALGVDWEQVETLTVPPRERAHRKAYIVGVLEYCQANPDKIGTVFVGASGSQPQVTGAPSRKGKSGRSRGRGDGDGSGQLGDQAHPAPATTPGEITYDSVAKSYMRVLGMEDREQLDNLVQAGLGKPPAELSASAIIDYLDSYVEEHRK